jgi:uncharacterized protein YndB with AHSA1/START domain
MSATPVGGSTQPLVKSLLVACGPAEAFKYFTDDFEKWWPLETHSCTAMSTQRTRRPHACVFESRVGGGIIEFADDGTQHVWGTVIEWDPPARVIFTWHPGRRPEVAQTVEVSFRAVRGGTEVVLIHGGWEKLAEEAARVRASYDNGWESVFRDVYAAYVARRPVSSPPVIA